MYKFLSVTLLALFSVVAVAQDNTKNTQTAITSQRVTHKNSIAVPTFNYLPTNYNLSLPRTIHRVAANGLTADFSIQDGTSQVTVWSENFDSDERDAKGNLKFTGWTFDYGEGSVITFEKKSTGFSSVDPSDVYSMHIDGPYQVYKRTKASATSPEISVPANGEFHAYVRMAPTWNSYVTLAIQVSADNFATYTELWKSSSITEGGSRWVPVTADLSAFAGKNVRIRLFWGPGTSDTFNTGGYMGDFDVDGLSVTGVSSVDQVLVKTGENIRFVDMSNGNVVSWQWSFPGGTPSSSTEQNPVVFYEKSGNYDVTLTVTDASGSDVVTKTSFVSVEGQLPEAAVGFPADFRDLTTRMRMVAPLAPVNYRDASAGYPTEYTWTLYTPYDLAKSSGFMFLPDTVYTSKDITYMHNTLDKCYVLHTVQNELGYTYVDDSVQVKFEGLVTNFLPTDSYQTNFVDGELTFPGSNKIGITAWAEKFSRPSVPVLLEAVYVNFTKASAEGITDQIAPVSFSLYTSENGLPGKPIDLLDTWTVSELNYAMSAYGGSVPLQLSKKYVIDEEVFLVIDGIPEKNDTLECAIGMAPMRSEGNTAYMLNKGVWRPMTGYFQPAPGGQTSLSVFPYYSHSVLIPANVDKVGRVTMGADSVCVGKEAGKTEAHVYANRGVYKYLGSDASWCRITGTPGEYTVDTLNIEYDALPAGIERREATVTLTDSVTTLAIRVVQSADVATAVGLAEMTERSQHEPSEVFDLQGRRVSSANLPKGIYIVRRGNRTNKIYVR